MPDRKSSTPEGSPVHTPAAAVGLPEQPTLQKSFVPLSPSSVNGFHMVDDLIVVVSLNGDISLLRFAEKELTLLATQSLADEPALETTCSAVFKGAADGQVHIVVSAFNSATVIRRSRQRMSSIYFLTIYMDRVEQSLTESLVEAKRSPLRLETRSIPTFVMPDYLSDTETVFISLFNKQSDASKTKEPYTWVSCHCDAEGIWREATIPADPTDDQDSNGNGVAGKLKPWLTILEGSKAAGAPTVVDYATPSGMINKLLTIGHHTGKLLTFWVLDTDNQGEHDTVVISCETVFESPISAVKTRIFIDSDGENVFTLVAPALGPVHILCTEGTSGSSMTVTSVLVIPPPEGHDVILSASWDLKYSKRGKDEELDDITVWLGHFGKVAVKYGRVEETVTPLSQIPLPSGAYALEVSGIDVLVRTYHGLHLHLDAAS